MVTLHARPTPQRKAGGGSEWKVKTGRKGEEQGRVCQCDECDKSVYDG
jgi:hypothetical protein